MRQTTELVAGNQPNTQANMARLGHDTSAHYCLEHQLCLLAPHAEVSPPGYLSLLAGIFDFLVKNCVSGRALA